MMRCSIQQASVEGGITTVGFADGSCYQYHNMWLRDACRDSTNVHESHERNLDNSPLMGSLEFAMGSDTSAEIDPDGSTLTINWSAGSVSRQEFDAHWLRKMANVVARQVEPPTTEAPLPESPWYEYLESSTGREPSEWTLQKAEGFQIAHFDHDELPSKQSEFMKACMDPGAVIVHGMPEDEACTGDVFSEFAMTHLGGLQKHPLRTEAHWTITTDNKLYEKKSAGGEPWNRSSSV